MTFLIQTEHPERQKALRQVSVSDRHLPEGLLPLREFVRFANNYFINSPFTAVPSASG